MKRQPITLGAYRYLIDVFDAYDDLKNEAHFANFVMLRNITLYNNITSDRDIFFIDKEIFDEMVEDMESNNYGNDTESYKIVWPMPYKIGMKVFSARALDFNDNIIRDSLYTDYNSKTKDYEFGYDVYKLVDKDKNLAEIRCNKCRIYAPVNHKENNLIIYIDNYINNIHFHYFCKQYTDYEVQSETIQKYANTEYSEFIEFWFPNIHDLFKVKINDDGPDEYSVFYNEDLDLVYSSENENFMSTMTSYVEDEETQWVPLNLLLQPFRIITEDGINKKQYLKLAKTIENNYLTHPFNITLFSYNDIDSTTGEYSIDEYMQSSTNTFLSECRFTLKSTLGFTNGKIAILTTFNYPNKEEFTSDYDDEGNVVCSAVRKAYEHYHNVRASMYDNFSDEQYQLLYAEINRLTFDQLTRDDKRQVYEKYGRNIPDSDILAKYKEMKINAAREEYEEELETRTDFIGFKIQISADTNFANTFYEKNESIQFNQLDDFAFELNGIFESWNELPEHLNARVMFVDRYIGTIIWSNFVVISKEWFKHMINDINVYRLDVIQTLNDDYNEKIKQANYNMNVIDLTSETSVNFINNINCTINKHNDAQSAENIQKITNGAKVLFKPIFFRVNDLQNIRIRRNVKQRIGVNLAEYMTKVETFKMLIDNDEIKESARNDVYVIFEINGATLSEESGRYDIVTQDDEYISTGNWSVY